MANEFGEALAAARQAARLSQAQLGALAGVTGAQIGHYERGADKPTPERCFAIEGFLDVPPGVLSRHLGYAPVDPSSSKTDYNSKIARMPASVRRTIDDIIDAEERRRGLR